MVFNKPEPGTYLSDVLKAYDQLKTEYKIMKKENDEYKKCIENLRNILTKNKSLLQKYNSLDTYTYMMNKIRETLDEYNSRVGETKHAN